MVSHVQLFAIPWTVAHQAPLSMEFFQARILGWVAISSCMRSSRHRDQTHISCISALASGFFGNPACRGTFGGRRKAVRDRLALQGGTGDFP